MEHTAAEGWCLCCRQLYNPPQILACQGAGVAVHGYYPLLFPSHGYHGQLWWLGDMAACLGQEANRALLAACKEGEVELPLYLEINLGDGQTVHIGPNLTSPNVSRLKKMPSITITTKGALLVATHLENSQEEKQEAAWEVVVPEPEEEKQEEVTVPEEKQEDGMESKLEKKKEEEKEEEEDEDYSESGDFPQEQTDNERDEELLKQRRSEARDSRKLLVYFDDVHITTEQLKTHFEQYGIVEDVNIVTSSDPSAVVIFASASVVSSLVGRTHSLGGSVPLRLRGGSGRRRVPPTLQRNGACSFR